NYEIRTVRAYTGVLPLREEKGGLYQSEFQADREKTKGNRIEGTIYAESPGYFITTIPYDENFEILADGKRVEAEVVNTAFLGFEIEAGKHEISIVYHAPGVKAGKMMSIAGVLMMLAVIAFDIAGGGCHKNLILKNIIL
ncbi:MAG: YfhO family protein, partial [Lachnospiraceae bacterium]|nr:YfhO family protein [Lachnospiraceae bacterium]